MMWQMHIVDGNEKPFPPRRSHQRAVNDCEAYCKEKSVVIATEWLTWLADQDDPDFEQRDDDYDYLELLYSYDCCEDEALRLASRYVWDNLAIIEV